MASFVAFCPRGTTSISAEELCQELVKRKLPSHIEHDEDGPYIVFDGSADVLHLTIMDGRIDYLEHAPAFGATPRLAGFIDDALGEIGFEWVDEDDPRWRAR